MVFDSAATQSQSEITRSGQPELAGRAHVIYLGAYLAILLVLLVCLLLVFWPEVVPATTVIPEDKTSPTQVSWEPGVKLPFELSFGPIPDEVRILLIVLFAGAIGNMIHTIRSFVMFVGNRQLITSWIPWYMLRPASGAALALVFYLVILLGLSGIDIKEFNFTIGGIAGLAALVGMFNDKTVEKLKEVFAAILSAKEPSRTTDQLKQETPNPKPAASGLDPKSVVAGAVDVSVTVTGSKFAQGAEARVDGESRSTEVKSDTEVIFILTAEDVAAAGDKAVTVVNPPPGGGESGLLMLKVT